MGGSSHDKATEDLVLAAGNGDRSAFDVLVQRYQGRLEAIAHLRLGPRLRRQIGVDDVLQETFLRAWSSLPGLEFRGNKAFFHWLACIAEHVVQDEARARLKAQKRGAGWKRIPLAIFKSGFLHRGAKRPRECSPLAHGVSPTRAMRRVERFQRLEAALDSLSADYREVIMLARIHELPMREIAARMGRSEDAVSMLLLRALRSLAVAFGTTDSLHLPAESLGERDAGGGERKDGDGGQLTGGAPAEA